MKKNIVLFLLFLAVSPVFAQNDTRSLIFPVPVDLQLKEGRFVIDSSVSVIIPSTGSEADIFLSKLLINEFADKYELALATSHKMKNKFILIGSISNPLIKNYCVENGWLSNLKGLGEEGYLLSVTGKGIVVAANTKNGALMGWSSLRQIIAREKESLSVQQLFVKDYPVFGFRGIKLYLPGRNNIPYFKRFIRDFAVLYKYNKIILELNANMRLDKHPELNIGAVKFARYLNYNRLDRPSGPHKEFQNSSHQDNGDGEILEKAELADLVKYVKSFGIEIIPELPSLTHSYYLLSGHEQLAENKHYAIPDTYCPLRPENYKIYFDVLDEYIEVMRPSMIHIGHDEWRMEKNICELCRGKDYGLLYANDVIKIHGYLAKKGIKVALWGDHLLESVTGKDHADRESKTGYKYQIPGALTPDQVVRLIPKDILVFNWFWDNIDNDKQISAFNFKQVYGNFRPELGQWEERVKIKGLLGGAPSSWAGTTELNFGKDQLFDLLGDANLLWSKHYLNEKDLSLQVEPLTGLAYSDLNGRSLPSDHGVSFEPINISPQFNSSLSEGLSALGSATLLQGKLNVANKPFDLGSVSAAGKKAIVSGAGQNNIFPAAIPLNKDVTSLLFLHATAAEGRNDMSFRQISNHIETASLLGWYEIKYEDGFVETIPIRYGVNILDWNWKKRQTGKAERTGNQNKYAYQASAVNCSDAGGDPVTFFLYEWKNPRFGKKVKDITLKTIDFTDRNKNAIILLALSASENITAKQERETERE